MYKWNPVFNLMMQIKKLYIEKFADIDYLKSADKTCLEMWVEKLNKKEYINILKYLQINQLNTMVLIRYGNYADVFGGEDEITNDTFWNMYNGIYNECRSVVIDLEKEIIVLSPFKKFRNVDETEENKLENILKEISGAKCVEITDKLDGSMQSARYVPEYGHIVMSGSQAIDVENSWRLQEGYNMLSESHIKMLKDNPESTFIFEYISMKDAHVVCYKEEQEGLYLIGIRNCHTGEQLSYADVIRCANRYNIRSTTIFTKTMDEVLQEVKTSKSNEKEGFVISIDGRMVKLKVDDYVGIHKILSKISSINLIIKHIADGQYDDLIAKVPQAYRSRIDSVVNLVFSYIHEMQLEVEKWYELAPKEDKKTFMIWCGENINQKYLGYVRAKYLGQPYNFIKGGNEKCPSYKRLNEITGNNNYGEVFADE